MFHFGLEEFKNYIAMAFREEELRKWEPMIASFIEEQRPREEIRSQVDLDYSIDIDDQSIEIFEIRPRWNSPDEKVKIPISKTKWVRRQRVWKIYWQRADMNWHKYDPLPQTDAFKEFIKELKEDPYACFWG